MNKIEDVYNLEAFETSYSEEEWDKSLSGLVTNAATIYQMKTEAQKAAAIVKLLAETDPLTSQMFEDAVAHIEAHGWCQGNDVEDSGHVCAQGAFALWTVKKVNGYMMRHHDINRGNIFASRSAEIMQLMEIPGSYGSVVGWNDWDGRTKEEVVDALTLAAKKLRDVGR